MDQQGFTRLQLSHLEHVVPDGQHGFGEAGGLFVAERFGDRHGRTFVGEGVLGVTAAGHQCADLLAALPARDAGADGLDIASDLKAKRFRRAGRRRILARALHEVGTIYACRAHPDEHLARTGRGLFDLVERERLSHHGLHRGHHRFGHLAHPGF